MGELVSKPEFFWS